MQLYYGDSINMSSRILDGQYDLTEVYGWTTITLDEPIPLVGDLPLYITFSFTSDYNIYPAAMSYYTGVSDGTWYKTPQGWRPYDQFGQCLTWMIRALFVERPCYVAVENAGYCDLDAFSGAGFYALGENATVGCSDPSFTHWEGLGNTDNELTFTVTGDTAFYAYCHEVGLEQADAAEAVAVGVADRTVTVQGPCDVLLRLYDIQGRLLASHPGSLCCQVPTAGVYILRVGQRPARKVVVME
jgi:hypothetical protein